MWRRGALLPHEQLEPLEQRHPRVRPGGEQGPKAPFQASHIRSAAAAASPAERLCAIADILEVSPYFDWFASSEALEAQRALDEAQGEYFSDRFYRAFNRPDLAPGTYTKANAGLITAKEAPRHRSAPLAACADARGWAALLWGHPPNRWEWEDPEPFLFSDHPSAREYMRRHDAAREGGEYIQITWPVVGVSFFTALAQFNGLALNAAAGRLLGLDETQTQWLGASAWEVDLAGMLLAGEMAIRPRATADEVWAHMLRSTGLGPALRAIREIGIGRADRPVHPARHPGIHPLRQRPGVSRRACAAVGCCSRRPHRLHRAGLTLGDRLYRELQCAAARRAPHRGDLLHPQGSPGSHRIVAVPLQRYPPTWQLGIPAAGTGDDHHPNWPPGSATLRRPPSLAEKPATH